MAAKKTNTAGKKSVLAEIQERLAALTPKQLSEPDLGPDKGFHAEGEAGDDIKRLFTLRRQLCNEHNVIGKKIEAAFEGVRKSLKSTNSLRSLADMLQTVAKTHEDEELLRLKVEASQKHSLHTIVDTIFWLEIRRQHPVLSDKPCVSIRRNWLVGWSDEEDAQFIELAGDRDMPRGLAEFLRSRMGR